jgi:hypothetical protein
MTRSLTEYRIFIGSPSGLQEERRQFRDAIERFNTAHGEPAGLLFAAVAWRPRYPARAARSHASTTI